jgi:branched-chain amino acid transport system ATP-binding protein
MPLLEVTHLTKRFGGLPAVNDVSFHVEEREIVGLIGPNGAGKTTTFNLVSGRFPATAGRVCLDGRDLGGLRPDQIAARGLARTFQGTRIFGTLTVEENVLTAILARTRIPFWSGWLGTGAARRAHAAARDEVRGILQWIGLEERSDEKAASLAYAHQSLLGVSLALALKPRLLLLDEPFAGMNPGETQRGSAMVRRIRDSGVTVVLVEHDMAAVMGVCDRIVVLDHGVKIAEGTPWEITRHPQVIEAYLGEDTDA